MAAPVTSSPRLSRLLDFIELDPGNLSLRKDAVREAFDTGHWEIARELIATGLHVHPDEPDLVALRGFAELQAQQYAEAEQSLSAALARGIDAGEVRYNLAFAIFMQKRYSDACDQLSTPAVLQVVPFALLLRARCFHHLGRPDEAIVDCRAYLAATPDDAEANGVLALILSEQEQREAARGHAEAALRRNPTQLEAMLALASMEFEARDYETAQLSFEALLLAHPRCGRAWLDLALIKLSHMQVEAAERDIELAAQYTPEHIGTWHVFAWIQLMRDEVAGAEAAFEKALAIDRNFGETHGGLAVVAALQGRVEEARTGIKRALKLDSQAMSPRYAEMVLLQREGKHAEAQAVLDAVLARPVARSDMQYRDLVAVQMRRMRERAGGGGPPVYH